ncbi:MAG: reprolysin-like metallopeptidase [Aeromonas sp.]|uniref:reprolysin-like metallopeptidase n=1 Tax=Aeromonas sp. TaxID=647 RepID=UPI003D6BDAA1
MRHGIAVMITCWSVQVAAEPRWTFMDESLARGAAYDVRADKVRVVVPDKPFETGDLARVLTLPLPDGTTVQFEIHPNALLPEALALRYPAIKTYSGKAIEQTRDTGRFELTMQGFHGMFTHQGRTFYIDPLEDGSSYAVYEQQHAWRRQDVEQVVKYPGIERARTVQVDGNLRKRYTIAISATGEYTRYHGGTKAAALSAIATLLNRINEVYRRDVGVEFQLAADTDKVIFTDPATDPFTNSTQDIAINQVQQDLLLNPSFDLGHLLATSGGGVATLRSLCNPFSRSRGMTGGGQPVGDAFYIDYVAHELGHQLGAEHSFNGTAESCAIGRNGSSAWEPGSGSTIMAYAGICGEENLQGNSAPFFHSKSIEQMRALMASLPSCGTDLALANNAPVVDAGGDRVIPANTPFTLVGSALDLDANPLSYTWEQVDLGNASSSLATMVDDGTRPLFRFVSPASDPRRTLPAMSSLLSGVLAKGEAWPATNRNLRFRLTVRDGQGAVSSDEMVVQVINTGAAFAITAPQIGAMVAGSSQLVTWNVAGTDQPPINCPSVDLALTQNGGATWTALASGLANNGSATVVLPASLTGTARLKLACSNNIFFSINGVSGNSAVTTESAAIITDNRAGGGGGALGIIVIILMGGTAIWRRYHG